MNPVVEDGVRILSLDGGGLNCLSELRILGEFMHRLEHDTGKMLRPFEYFHLITGVGASGVIAILLGVLGLSVDDASAAFLLLCKAVSLDEKLDPEWRSAKLVAAIKDVLHVVRIPEGRRLREHLADERGCKVSVPYLSAVGMASCRMMRNYNSKHSSHNPTIVEAICIAWAIPGLFAPVDIGTTLTQERLIGAVDGFNNPTLQAINEAFETFGGDQRIACLLSLGSGRPLTSASNMDRPELARRVAQDTESYVDLFKSRYSGLQIYFRFSVDHNLEPGADYGPINDQICMINAYTATYLNSYDASDALDVCVRSSLRAGQVTMYALVRTQTSSTRSSHGLPPLSAFFVARTEPLDKIATALQRNTLGSPAIALVIGMSGTGKTQISLKYAYEHGDEYGHVLFIDASSPESIEKTLVARIRGIDRLLHPAGAEEALELLANPEGNLTRNWLIIMDNADSIDLRDYIPSCDHGAILITSRNTALVELYPEGHIAMGVMSLEEAVEALLSTAFGLEEYTALEGRSGYNVVDDKYTQAVNIVGELGRLPLAVIQAACYIKKHKCLPDYSSLLKTSRSKILRWPASVQRDKLRYAHSTYAAFDTNISALSPRALQLLGLFSCFHFTDFPRPLIALAASLGFKSQPHDLLDQPPQYQQSIDFLHNLFCPEGHWDQTEFDALLEELQTYSLVTIVPVFTMITLRFHPLLHGWASDRLASSEKPLFRSAAARVLVCGTSEDDDHFWPYLSPHVERFMSTDDAHVNDLAALVAILKRDGHAYKVRNVLEEVYATVESVHGEKHVRSTRAGLQLADAVGLQGDLDRMEAIIKNVVEIRKQSLGHDHLETAEAVAALARAYKLQARYEESAHLELDVLSVCRANQGSRHRDIAKALSSLGETFMLQENYAKACTLLNGALEIMIALVGRSHVATVRIMEQLSQCHKYNGDVGKYIQLEREIIDLWRNIRGSMHTKTFDVMTKLATFYLDQGHHSLAETLLRELENGRREMLGKEHDTTLDALYCLSKAILEQGRHAEAEVLLKQVLVGRRGALGDKDKTTLEAQETLANAIYAQGRLDDAETAFRELAEARQDSVGEQNLDTLRPLRQLAYVLDDQGRHKEAEEIWGKVLEGMRETLGDQHEDTIAAFGRLADSINEQDRYEEAGFLRVKMRLADQARRGETQEVLSTTPETGPAEGSVLATDQEVSITGAVDQDLVGPLQAPGDEISEKEITPGLSAYGYTLNLRRSETEEGAEPEGSVRSQGTSRLRSSVEAKARTSMAIVGHSVEEPILDKLKASRRLLKGKVTGILSKFVK